MEVSKLLNDVSSFTNFMKSNVKRINEVLKIMEKSITTVQEQLDVYSTVKQVNIPPNVLERFPDLKKRVMANLCTFIDEEIHEIKQSAYRIQEFSSELRKLFDKIEKSLFQINWNEHMSYVTAFTHITEWAEKCWKFFHFIYINVSNGLRMFHFDDAHSAAWIKNIKTVDGVDMNYIFENPVSDLFQMLKKDFSSRSKISVASFPCNNPAL